MELLVFEKALNAVKMLLSLMSVVEVLVLVMITYNYKTGQSQVIK